MLVGLNCRVGGSDAAGNASTWGWSTRATRSTGAPRPTGATAWRTWIGGIGLSFCVFLFVG